MVRMVLFRDVNLKARSVAEKNQAFSSIPPCSSKAEHSNSAALLPSHSLKPTE